MIEEISALMLSMVTPGPCGILHVGNIIRECKPGWIYMAKCDDIYKIGRSSQKRQYLGVRHRIKNLCELTNRNFVFYRAIRVCCVVGFEKYLHEQFQACAQGNELFKLSAEDLGFIEALTEFANEPVQHILTAP